MSRWYKEHADCTSCGGRGKYPVEDEPVDIYCSACPAGEKLQLRDSGLHETRIVGDEDAVEAVLAVYRFFDDSDKAVLWMKTPNPMLGGITPWDMVILGKSAKLLAIVRAELKENEVKLDG